MTIMNVPKSTFRDNSNGGERPLSMSPLGQRLRNFKEASKKLLNNKHQLTPRLKP